MFSALLLRCGRSSVVAEVWKEQLCLRPFSALPPRCGSVFRLAPEVWKEQRRLCCVFRLAAEVKKKQLRRRFFRLVAEVWKEQRRLR